METAIKIGAGKKALKKARKLVLDIITTSNSEQVKIAALHVLTSCLSVNNASVSNCSFVNNEKRKKQT